MYPFLAKIKGKTFVRLHKALYGKPVMDHIKKELADSVVSIVNQKQYHLVELSVEETSDYLDFLNFALYWRRRIS